MHRPNKSVNGNLNVGFDRWRRHGRVFGRLRFQRELLYSPSTFFGTFNVPSYYVQILYPVCGIRGYVYNRYIYRSHCKIFGKNERTKGLAENVRRRRNNVIIVLAI